MPTDGSIAEQFVASFLEEARETIEQWEALGLELERNPSSELWQALARALHNLKGSAATVGLRHFSDFLHAVEDRIAPLKEGLLRFDPSQAELLLEGQSLAADWLGRLEQDVHFVAEPGNYLERWRTVQAVAQAGDAESEPASERAAADDGQSELQTSSGLNPAIVPFEGVEIFSVDDDECLPGVEAQGAEQGPPEPPSSPGSTPAPCDADPEDFSTEARASGGQRKKQDTIRVSCDKLDSLVGAVSELSVNRLMLTHHLDNGTLLSQRAAEAIRELSKISRELQELTLAVRLQPIKPLFQRLERTARDLARAQKKPLAVRRHGEDVELDKTILERIVDPLMHVVRNAVDHGIELPDQRVAAGKPEKATLLFEARQEASGVTLVLSDDGKGLDAEKILRKAIDLQLVGKDARPPLEEIYRFILRPGFSTARQVTSTSGRGVGMDVVKRIVDEMGGSLDIESAAGKGTAFIVSLPAGLSLIGALIVRVHHAHYVIPVSDVAEVLDVRDTVIERRTPSRGIFEHREQAVSIHKMDEFLPVALPRGGAAQGSTEAEAAPPRAGELPPRPALITRRGQQLIAFEVDDVSSMETVVVKDLTGELAKHGQFSGGVTLGNGHPALVLNMQHLMDRVSASMLREQGLV